MKTQDFIKPLSVVIGLLLAFTLGCEEDSKDEIDNHISYDGETYNISKGFHGFWGRIYIDAPEVYGIYKHKFFLYSSGISIDEQDTSFVGKGNLLGMVLFSGSDKLKEGTYSTDLDLIKKSYGINYAWFEPEEGDGINADTFVSLNGEITIEKSDDEEYKISIDCYNSEESEESEESEKKLTGSYKGELKYYDYSD